LRFGFGSLIFGLLLVLRLRQLRLQLCLCAGVVQNGDKFQQRLFDVLAGHEQERAHDYEVGEQLR
jgi:hypothetical protein